MHTYIQKSILLFFLITSVSIQVMIAQTTLIPDANFEQALIDLGYDSGMVDGSVETANISGIITLNIFGEAIEDLTGIEDFVALVNLRVNDCQLTTLDLTNNLGLKEVKVYKNNLIDINLSNNAALETLLIYENQLSGIDLSNNINLVELNIRLNNLSSIDLSFNEQLEVLEIGGNVLEDLDVSKNPNLKELWCQENKLSSLNFSNNPLMEKIVASENLLEEVDISVCTVLKELWVLENSLAEINVSANTALKKLYLDNNLLQSIDLSTNVVLENFRVPGNLLTTIDVSQQEFLIQLDCHANKLAELDVSSNLDLEILRCGENDFTALDISNNEKLKSFFMQKSKMDALDLSTNPALTYVNLIGNSSLSCLDLRNGSNELIDYFYATECPKLTCIDVDNPVYASDNWTSIDPQQSFEEECTCIPVGVSEKSFVGQLSVYPNPTSGFIAIEFDQPSKGILKVYDPAGRLIQSIKVDESDRLNYELDGKPGIYLVEFLSETGAVFVGKVLKMD